MKLWWIVMALLVACVGIYGLTGCANQSAQSNSGANARSGGGQQGGGSAKFSQFRDEHKYTFMLMKLARNLARMEKEQQTPLTQAQAKTILQVLTPLRSKTSLSQDEAKATIRQIKPLLTERQLTEIGKMKSARQPGSGAASGGQDAGSAGGSAGGGQGRGGQSGQAGQRPRMDPAQMKNFNPFNPPAGSPMAERGDQWQEMFDLLTAKATGVPVASSATTAPAPDGAHHGHGQHRHTQQ